MLKHLGSMGSLGPCCCWPPCCTTCCSWPRCPWPKNYVRTVDLDANVGVAPSSVRGPAVPGQRAAREGSLRGSIAMLMVGAKVLLAVLVHGGRAHLEARGYRIALQISGGVLVLFGLSLLWNGGRSIFV